MARARRTARAREKTKEQIRKWFGARAKRGTLSPAHDLTHVESVSAHAGILAQELARKSYPQQALGTIRDIAEAAGNVHDIVRRATERVPHGTQGAETIKRLRTRFPKAFGEFQSREIQLLADATRVHELSFPEFNKAIRNFSKRKRIIARAVYTADKLFEASGYRAIERRAFFVGNERMKTELAGLRTIYGKNAPLYAVAMESCMRLRARNVLGDYPKAIQPIARPLHATQQKFYFGLLKYLGISEATLVQEMEKVNFPKFDQYRQRIISEVAKAQSNRAVSNISNDVSSSAAELVMRFNKASSPETALKKWKPKGTQANEWLQGIRGARIGGKQYLDKVQRQIRTALAKS